MTPAEVAERLWAFADDVRARPEAYAAPPWKAGDAMRSHMARAVLRGDLLRVMRARAGRGDG